MSVKDGIAAVLCPDCLAQLIEAYGGRVVRIPARQPTDVDGIRRDLDAGETYRATAQRHGVCLSTVVRVAK
jgi:hypothetical protein